MSIIVVPFYLYYKIKFHAKERRYPVNKIQTEIKITEKTFLLIVFLFFIINVIIVMPKSISNNISSNTKIAFTVSGKII